MKWNISNSKDGKKPTPWYLYHPQVMPLKRDLGEGVWIQELFLDRREFGSTKFFDWVELNTLWV